ncbi:MAG TPA: class I SAM-dependent methyltransferase [Polyangiaceae bacterium]|nr:class I SAM-dependent methyltransferase [Polyangiaceae bacterium]
MSGKARSPEARTIRDFGAAADDGAKGHYEDPAYYAKTYKDRRHDVDYYVRLARQAKGPVLEYGVGNGRIALHVARAGVEVHGVDLSRPMLADFEERLKLEPKQVRARVSLAEGDMRTYALGKRVPLVYAPFNCFLHLYTRPDVEAFLARVKAHLAPGGRFVFDFSVPHGEDLSRDPERSYGSPKIRHPTTGELVKYAERFEYDRLRQLLLIWMEFEPEGSGKPWKVPLTHRQFFPREVEALLHYNGFSEIFFTADFTDQPADQWVDSMVVSCRVVPAATRSARKTSLVSRRKVVAASKKKRVRRA